MKAATKIHVIVFQFAKGGQDNGMMFRNTSRMFFIVFIMSEYVSFLESDQ